MELSQKFILFFLTCLLSASTCLWAQPHYEPGFVVLTSGDSLYGKVKDRKPGPFGRIYERVRFRDGGWFSKKYSPDKLLAYQAGDRQYESLWLSKPFSLLDARMISVSGRGRKKFLRVLLKGPLSYYSLENFDREAGFFDDIPYLKRENTREFVRATQGAFGLKRKLLAEYFDDCPAMQKALEDKQLRSVFEVVDYFNSHCVINQYYNPDYKR